MVHLKNYIPTFLLAFAQDLNPLQATTLGDLLDRIATLLFNLAIILAPIGILAGGVIFLTATNPSRIALGKRILLWTAVIFGIILIGKLIISVSRGELTFH
jgi:hypothetical protein